MQTSGAILIVEDDPDVVRAARVALMSEGRQVEVLASLNGLADCLGAREFDAVLLDMNFVAGERSGREGLDGLARILQHDPTLSVVLMTAYGGVALAVEALKRGAMDFILKPWRNEKLVESMQTAVQRTAERRASALNLDVIERAAIEKALAKHAGNISSAAAALGLSRAALYRRIAKHGL